MPRHGPRYDEADARDAVARSRTYAEALRRLGMRAAGGNHQTLRKYVERWGITVEHFDPDASRREVLSRCRPPSPPLDEVLVEHSTYARQNLKRRLYQSGLKQRVCEECGQTESWRGRRMALILDHVNGVADDNRLVNLRILCPNCAATLDTHCGRNLRLIRRCAACGVSFKASVKEQRHCSRRCGGRSEASVEAGIAMRRVERPPYAQLLAEVEEVGYFALGRRYGVSDNAIRKWIRQYERELARGADSARPREHEREGE